MTVKKFVNQKELCEITGVNRRQIYKLQKKGIIKKTKAGKYNLSDTKKILQIDRDHSRVKKNNPELDQDSGSGLSGGGFSLPEAIAKTRLQKEISRLRLNELEYKKKIGEVLEFKEVENLMQDLGQQIKSEFLKLANTLPPKVASVSSLKKCKEIIKKDVDMVLRRFYDLSKEIRKNDID